jgi:formylglycine-generating enzyme required for sulfatase activity
VALAAAVCAAASCADASRGVLMVTFKATGVTPDALDVEVDWPNGSHKRAHYGNVAFPATLAVVTDSDPDQPIVLIATASSAGVLVDAREVTVASGIPATGTRSIEIDFDGSCAAFAETADGGTVISCPAGTSCAGSCSSSEAASSNGSDAEAGPGEVASDAGPTSDDSAPGAGDGEPACSNGAVRCAGLGGQTTETCLGGTWTVMGDCTPGVTHCVAGACVPTPPSCAGAKAPAGASFTCGGTLGQTDCCAAGEVPGGTFDRSYDGVSYVDPGFPATISTFWLDDYEVTVGRFRRFVAALLNGNGAAVLVDGAGKHTHLNNSAGVVSADGRGTQFETGWQMAWTSNLPQTQSDWDAHLAYRTDAGLVVATWTSQSGPFERLPIINVDWYDAYAFCIWDGGFLPTSAEWNYAASGGSEQRVYAWGNNPPGPDPSLSIYSCYYGGAGMCGGLTNIAPVGSAPAGNGKWGHSDLTGNVWELTLDLELDSAVDAGLYADFFDPCNDCANTTSGPGRIARSGAFDNPATPVSAIVWTPSDIGHPNLGFRCARSPQR